MNQDLILRLREYTAKRSQNKIWGNGDKFESNDKKISKFFNNYNTKFNITQLFSYGEIDLSLTGRKIYVFDKLLDGSVRIHTPSPYFYEFIGQMFSREYLCVIYQKITVDNQFAILQSTYDWEKVVHRLLTTDEKEQVIFVYDEQKKIKKLGLQQTWYHNLGFALCFQLTNVPFYNTMTLYSDFDRFSDWYNATWLEGTICDALDNMNRDIVINHSRIWIGNANQNIIDSHKQDIISNSNSLDNVKQLSDIIYTTRDGSEFEVYTAQNKIDEYEKFLENLLDLYFSFSFSWGIGKGTGAQKTSSEINSKNISSMEYFNLKINHRNHFYNMLLKAFFAVNGLCNFEKENKFTYSINGNLSIDETVRIDNLIKEVQIGSKSVVDVISEINSISIEDSQEKYKTIKKFNEENDIQTNLSVGGGANVPNTAGKGGAPEKKVDDSNDNK